MISHLTTQDPGYDTQPDLKQLLLEHEFVNGVCACGDWQVPLVDEGLRKEFEESRCTPYATMKWWLWVQHIDEVWRDSVSGL